MGAVLPAAAPTGDDDGGWASHVLEDDSTDEHGMDTYQLDVVRELRAIA